MKKESKKVKRFIDYERIEMKDVVTFGTNVWIRKDRRALIIVFPAGQELHFKPEWEIADERLEFKG